MNEIVTLLIFVAALGILIEALRRLRRLQNNANKHDSLPQVERFDEADPTQTGIFRAREILSSKEEKSRQRRSTADLARDDNISEDEALPDPFDNSKE